MYRDSRGWKRKWKSHKRLIVAYIIGHFEKKTVGTK